MVSPLLNRVLLEAYIERVRDALSRDYRKAYLALMGADLERVSSTVRAIVRGELDLSFAGYTYHDLLLEPLGSLVSQRCLLLEAVSPPSTEGF